MTIGYYVHHQGRGHLHRALSIAHALGDGVTGLSSLDKPADWRGEWIQLAADDSSDTPRETTAGGVLHWAPLHDAGLSARMATIAAWIDRARPRAIVVDVSVEVALLCRLHGVPVVTVGMPGDRTDPVHTLGYAVSTAVIGAWPAAADGISVTPASVDVTAVGGISRYSGREVTTRPHPRRVLVLLGAGGESVHPRALEAAQQQTPEWDWQVLGGSGAWVDDPWEQICSASVVVTHAGQNSVADVAAARRPAIIVPQPRPHDEQLATARVLGVDGWPALVAETFPAAGWAELLARAAQLDGERWQRWTDGNGARRAAEVIREVAS